MSKPKTNDWDAMASMGIVVMFLSLLVGSRLMFAVGVFFGVLGSLAMIFNL